MRRLLAGAALLVPVLAGCEAGGNAPTLEFHQASGGTHADVNGIIISNAFVLGGPSGSSVPPGSSVSLFLGLFNGTASDDQLVSVSAPGTASRGQIMGGSVSLPTQGAVDLTGPEPKVVLDNTSKTLSGGQDIPVTLDFRHAGLVTLQIPVEPYSDYYTQYSQPPATTPPPSPSSAPAGRPKASPRPGASKASPSPSSSPSSKASPKPSASPTA